MRANEFLPEKVNQSVFQRGFEKTKPYGKYTLIAKPGDMPYIPGKKARASDQFRIEAYHGKAMIGWVNFLPTQKGSLEAMDLFVNEEHRLKGIAKAMYKFATDLKNDITPSPMQTPDGKAFWGGKPSMRADESMITELGNAPMPYEPMALRMGRKGFENKDLDLRVFLNMKGEYVLTIEFFVGMRFDITKGGNAIKILSTVVSIIKNEVPKFLAEEPGIGMVRFTADQTEPSRIKLYNRAVPVITAILGSGWFFKGAEPRATLAPTSSRSDNDLLYQWKKKK